MAIIPDQISQDQGTIPLSTSNFENFRAWLDIEILQNIDPLFEFSNLDRPGSRATIFIVDFGQLNGVEYRL